MTNNQLTDKRLAQLAKRNFCQTKGEEYTPFGDEVVSMAAELKQRRAADKNCFMYGIVDPDGKAHMDEFCVSNDIGLLEVEVSELNRNEGTDGYRVVALYTALPLTDSERAELQELRKAAMDSESVGNEFIPKNLDKALGVVGMALPESKEEFNFQIERWIQRLIDRVIRYADEFKEQPAPVTTSEEHRQLCDLVMMVKMLCRTVRKYNPESQQAANFTAYLQKEGLISAADCLRGSDLKETDTEDLRG